jgi:anti-sigma-K factor RskA
MDYSNTQLQSLLAGEYVLGTLRGRAAKRFERLLESEPGMRDALHYWQQRLNPLVEVIKPIEPPARVWKTIQNRIHKKQSLKSGPQPWNNSGFWRGFALASIMLVIGYGIGNWQAVHRHSGDTSQYVAILQNQHEQPMFVASVTNDGKALRLDMLTDDDMPKDQVMQAWCMPKGGGKPVSLGIINAKSNRFEMNSDEMEMLHESEEITVSMEPMGGSPMEEPTGPVMYRGNII